MGEKKNELKKSLSNIVQHNRALRRKNKSVLQFWSFGAFNMCNAFSNKVTGFKWGNSYRKHFGGLKYSNSIFQVFLWKFSRFILSKSDLIFPPFLSPTFSFFLRPDQGKCYPFSLPDAHPCLSHPLLWSITNLFSHCLTTELLFLLNSKLKINWFTDWTLVNCLLC